MRTVLYVVVFALGLGSLPGCFSSSQPGGGKGGPAPQDSGAGLKPGKDRFPAPPPK